MDTGKGSESMKTGKLSTFADFSMCRVILSKRSDELITFTPKRDLALPPSPESARSRRGCSGPWCVCFCGGAAPEFPQVLSGVNEEDRSRGMPQPVRCDLPCPDRSARGAQPQVERAV
jgi:hypothetical protein